MHATAFVHSWLRLAMNCRIGAENFTLPLSLLSLCWTSLEDERRLAPETVNQPEDKLN
jgi:hypothetical protein